MKILIVSDAWHPQVNGVVRTYERLRQELENRGHQIDVISPADFKWTMPLPGYREIRLALAPYNGLRARIEAFGPDHIHAATEGPLGCAARKYAVRNKREFSTAFHTQFPDYIAQRLARTNGVSYKIIHALVRGYLRRFHKPARFIMVSTRGLERQLHSWGFQNRMAVVTRGVDTDLFQPGEKTLFQNLKRPVALYVGRLSVEKSVGDFLDMPWTGSKVIVGDGPSLPALKAQYPGVLFAGRRFGPDLAAHYRSSDVFAFPSRTDTFGLVIIEALASGLPVAAYNVMGPQDIITEPFLGALGDDLSKAAADALERGDAETRARHVKRHYAWETAARQLEDAIRGSI